MDYSGPGPRCGALSWREAPSSVGPTDFPERMVTVTVETSVSSRLEAIWTALGRRPTYFYFPGISGTAKTECGIHA